MMSEDDEDGDKRLVKERLMSHLKNKCDIDLDDILISKR